MISRRAISGVLFREFVFQSSLEFTSKESFGFARKSTFTFRIKTSKSPGSQFNGDHPDPKDGVGLALACKLRGGESAIVSPRGACAALHPYSLAMMNSGCISKSV